MKSYHALIKQGHHFSCDTFRVSDNHLQFNGVDLKNLLTRHQAPLKLSYLPKIGERIQQTRKWFSTSMEQHGYTGNYTYCYCTKASHFAFVIEEALAKGAEIEISSAYDIHVLHALYEKGKLNKQHHILCNGFKPPEYIQHIVALIKQGFTRCIPILDNLEELPSYLRHLQDPFDIGLRVAAEEEPNFGFYTSRLGICHAHVVPYYQETISQSHARLKMLHFFIHSGIKDTAYFWSEFGRLLTTYCDLKKHCAGLDTLDIGGGFPIRHSLDFSFDYASMIDKIILQIQQACKKNGVATPHLITEFGTYSVGESGALIYPVLGEKVQNDKERWYMIDGSFITQLPDSWALKQRYLLLPINHWDKPFHRVTLGGLSCDSMDYYNSEAHGTDIFLPKLPAKGEEPLYLGLFHTGAYQDALGGYGGVQHCLLPHPKHVIIGKDQEGKLYERLFRPTQSSESMLALLGYRDA